ncbi:DNA/RNA polymerases superfamily protein [Striga asiatica]|uniref:DNA/RNA polymerases superfamily protein n=1 Tax=Striga asiatica TaxID=4170 RepID=A0A5A7RBF0_STRAF|nr:DNA/RNA polymerases superfamily protein [Striga asiatica]
MFVASTALNIGSLGTQLLNPPAQNPIKPFLHPPAKNPILKSSNPLTEETVHPCQKISDRRRFFPSHRQGEQEEEASGGSKKSHFVVANAKFMLDEEEHFKELMFEPLWLFGERNKEQDFWLVIEPKFLNKFPNVTKRLKRPAVALVSQTALGLRMFMKLRLDRVLQESFEAENLEEALVSNPADLEFEKLEKWTAPYGPYPNYKYGWWEPFLPPKTSKV